MSVLAWELCSQACADWSISTKSAEGLVSFLMCMMSRAERTQLNEGALGQRTARGAKVPDNLPHVLLGIRMHIFALCQYANYTHASYACAGQARVARVTFAVGLGAVWC